MDKEALFEDCVEDVCAVSGMPLLMSATACSALEEMAYMCLYEGVVVGNYEKAAKCSKYPWLFSDWYDSADMKSTLVDFFLCPC